jgi:hypothetical protein
VFVLAGRRRNDHDVFAWILAMHACKHQGMNCSSSYSTHNNHLLSLMPDCSRLMPHFPTSQLT